MKLDEGSRSDNVEEDTGGGGGGGIRGVHLGLGGTAIVLVVGYFMGINPLTMLGLLNSGGQTASAPSQSAPVTDTNADPQKDFVRVVLGYTEQVWGAYFTTLGKTYVKPKLHLYHDRVDSACGLASAAAGPFYCPGDQKVYLDLSFFNQLSTQFAAPGDFARAYVIAHEVGHHVQNLLGITDKASQEEQHAGKLGANKVSVMVELQADCYAGVWAEQANATKKILDPGDLDSALTAAASVGDDTLQRREQGTVVPDSFTHGTSAQRQKWFRRGFDTGKIDNCDTFNAGADL